MKIETAPFAVVWLRQPTLGLRWHSASAPLVVQILSGGTNALGCLQESRIKEKDINM
jgi:hypothetical protein